MCDCHGDFMKKIIRVFSLLLSVICLIILISGSFAAYLTPDRITVSSDSKISFCKFPISMNYSETAVYSDDNKSIHTPGKLMLFGSIPLKEISVTVSDRLYAIPGGEPFGIRLYTDGLVVSKTSDIPTADGICNPSAEAGIKTGDIILSVSGKKLRTNEQLMTEVENSGGNIIFLECKRGGKKFTAGISPVKDIQLGRYRIGLWVRDSCAGIGTVTFTDADTMTFAGLGHGITDSSSGNIMPLSEGDIVKADISSVTKSYGGMPGSLEGYFSDGKAIGSIRANSECGLYGILKEKLSDGEKLPIAFRQEVVRGKAQIRCTVSGSKAEYFDIEIEEISYNNANITKNMVIKITDERLLSKTGGIVQGMSGSPIIQNGRIAGAVTHVFINDPSHGYAIFAENMAEYNNELIQKTSR